VQATDLDTAILRCVSHTRASIFQHVFPVAADERDVAYIQLVQRSNTSLAVADFLHDSTEDTSPQNDLYVIITT
jgi:hypothetical protein